MVGLGLSRISIVAVKLGPIELASGLENSSGSVWFVKCL